MYFAGVVMCKYQLMHEHNNIKSIYQYMSRHPQKT